MHIKICGFVTDINKYNQNGSDAVMKIEKLSEKQIRCILDKADLADRHLKLSELAFGTEKAKELFRDMMRQASYEFGFDAENMPLMIEAIPVSSECIVLVITKVDDPEELDTRFSRFTPDEEYDPDDFGDDIEDIGDMSDDMSDDYTDYSVPDNADDNNGADDVISLFNKVREYLNKNVVPVDSDAEGSSSFVPFNQSLKGTSDSKNDSTGTVSHFQTGSGPADSSAGFSHRDNPGQPVQLNRIFSFDSLDTICEAAGIIAGIYDDRSTLYKDPSSGRYYLFIERTKCSPTDFNKVCNILTEFGRREHPGYASSNFFAEHYELLIKDNAIRKLATI